MGRRPEEIATDIEATRRSLDRTLEELEERLSPARMAQRRVERGGLAPPPREVEAGTAGAASADALQTGHSPLGGGLLAFGAGLLAAAAMPPTDTESRAVRALVLRVGRPAAGNEELSAEPDENRD